MSTIRAAGRGNGQLPALVCLLLGGALAPARGADGPPRLADVLGGLERVRRLEFVQMATALAGGSDMSRPGDGWFKPSQSRYTWKWLAARYDKDRDGKVTEKELGAPAELFARLDRNGDGSVTEGDLDWSGSSLASMTFMGKFMPAIQTFQRNDRDSNGKVSRAEWDKLFDQLAKGKDFLIPEDLQELLSPPRPAGG